VESLDTADVDVPDRLGVALVEPLERVDVEVPDGLDVAPSELLERAVVGVPRVLDVGSPESVVRVDVASLGGEDVTPAEGLVGEDVRLAESLEPFDVGVVVSERVDVASSSDVAEVDVAGPLSVGVTDAEVGPPDGCSLVDSAGSAPSRERPASPLLVASYGGSGSWAARGERSSGLPLPAAASSRACCCSVPGSFSRYGLSRASGYQVTARTTAIPRPPVTTARRRGSEPDDQRQAPTVPRRATRTNV